MADTPQLTENSIGTTDRRSHARRQIQSLAYVDLGEDNGGLVLNMGEGGIGVRSAVGMATDVLPKIRFQMPQSLAWVEATGRIAWTGDSKRMAGIEFIDLPQDAGNQIRKWMTSEVEEAESRANADEELAVGAESADAADGAEPAAFAAAIGVSDAVISGGIAADTKPAPSAKTSAMLIALANKATARAATTTAAEPPKTNTPAEQDGNSGAASSEADQAAGRPAENLSSWANSSILNLSVAATAQEKTREREPRRWPQVLGIVVILAGLSFYLGISASRVGIHQILASMKGLLTGGNAANGAQSGGTDTTATASAPLAPVQAARPNVANSGDSRATPPDANAASAAPPNGGAPAQASDKPAPSFTIRRAASGDANGANGSANADAGDGATPVLSLADAPVSASNSVAVSARLYIPLPQESGSQHGGNLQIGRLDRRIEIAYPQEASQQRVEGIVKLHIVIGPDGAVRNVTVLNGDPTLAAAASDAIRQWQYKPTMLDGQPIETEADVTVTFRLPQVTQ